MGVQKCLSSRSREPLSACDDKNDAERTTTTKTLPTAAYSYAVGVFGFIHSPQHLSVQKMFSQKIWQAKGRSLSSGQKKAK